MQEKTVTVMPRERYYDASFCLWPKEKPGDFKKYEEKAEDYGDPSYYTGAKAGKLHIPQEIVIGGGYYDI